MRPRCRPWSHNGRLPLAALSVHMPNASTFRVSLCCIQTCIGSLARACQTKARVPLGQPTRDFSHAPTPKFIISNTHRIR